MEGAKNEKRLGWFNFTILDSSPACFAFSQTTGLGICRFCYGRGSDCTIRRRRADISARHHGNLGIGRCGFRGGQHA